MRRDRKRRGVGRPLAILFRKLGVEPLEVRALLSADGISAPASGGAPEGESQTPKIVQYTVQALAPGTDTPLTEILAGRSFDMQILVQDLRSEDNPNRGVFATYTDLLYDKSLAKIRVAEVQTLTISGTA